MSRHSRCCSTSPPTIILYDSPGTRAQTWVPNIWRIRFILNYKRLHYRTVWVEFPDVEATLRGIGAPPSATKPDGRPIYCLPVIVDPTRNSKAPHILSNAHYDCRVPRGKLPCAPRVPRGLSRAADALRALHPGGAGEAAPPYHGPAHPRPPTGAYAVALPLGACDDAAPTPAPAGATTRTRVGHRQGAVRLSCAGAGQEHWRWGRGCRCRDTRFRTPDFALCAMLLWIEQMAPHDGWSRVRDWNGGRWANLRHKCKDYMDVL
ncbi:hypothetical protein B0H14DRAFT_2706681 [Mycena olivaceomarginata]|nr:hypothetical protein B0H14DRAFT_2706681 [Mycena olivaceomarginata]